VKTTLVNKMTHRADRGVKDLVEMALKTNLREFVQLTSSVDELLGREKGRIGRLNITGRLIATQPIGEATVIGDIHGDVETLAEILHHSGFLKKTQRDEKPLLVFMGDYGDRGIYSPEVYYIVLKLKETHPEQVVLMRGNHEGPDDLMPSPHDLPSHLQRKFGEDWSQAYGKLRQLFANLYNALLITDTCVLLHAGVPSQAKSIDDLAWADKKHPNEPHLEEILWSDPEEGIEGTYPSPRGAGRLFGKDITDRFLQMLNVKLLIRGHEPSENGYRINHKGEILTLFSRKGDPYSNKQAAYLQLGLARAVENAYELKDSLKLL
jgi:protein phosphatase